MNEGFIHLRKSTKEVALGDPEMDSLDIARNWAKPDVIEAQVEYILLSFPPLLQKTSLWTAIFITYRWRNAIGHKVAPCSSFTITEDKPN